MACWTGWRPTGRWATRACTAPSSATSHGILPNTRPGCAPSWAANGVLARVHAKLAGITDSDGQLRAALRDEVRQVLAQVSTPEGSTNYETLVTSIGADGLAPTALRPRLTDDGKASLPTVERTTPLMPQSATCVQPLRLCQAHVDRKQNLTFLPASIPTSSLCITGTEQLLAAWLAEIDVGNDRRREACRHRNSGHRQHRGRQTCCSLQSEMAMARTGSGTHPQRVEDQRPKARSARSLPSRHSCRRAAYSTSIISSVPAPRKARSGGSAMSTISRIGPRVALGTPC